MKANGGILIIDDLGPAADAGRAAAQPLDRRPRVARRPPDAAHRPDASRCRSTCCSSSRRTCRRRRLADEAFLRRIRYKIEIPSPDAAQYREILRRECAARSISYDDSVCDYLFERWYTSGRELRGCHPRDIIEAIVDAATHDGKAGVLSRDAIDEACASYFLAV